MSCIITYNGQNFTQEDFLNYLKSQIPASINNLSPIASIPQNLISGQEAFGTLQHATPEVKAILGENPTSIDMIEAGLRTRTTRSVGEMQKYNVKVGDIVKQFGKSADGTTKQILTRITAIHPKGSPEFLNTWEKEGWTQEGIKAIQRYKDGAAAIEFEIIKDEVQPIDQIEARDHFNFQNSETLLQSIVSHPDVPQYLKDLVKQLLDKVNVKDINIETYAGNSKSVGLYNNTTNTVTINLRQFRENKTSTVERISETIVHEYIHAATTKGIRELQAGLNNNIHLKNIQSLFEDYRKDLIKEAGYQEFLKYLEKVKTKQDLTIAERQKGRELQNKYYAALKVEEFVTMGLSNPTTRETLKSRNLLQKLFDSIASFLGLDNNMFTLLEQEYDKYLDSVNNNKQTFQEDNISKLDTYQYYGKTYQIHTVDGVGVKVEGYMGSNVEQQALLAAYNNNKDVDPQNGKPFRNTQVNNSSNNTKKQSTFSYKGVTIDTDFQLGEQQEEALKTIIDFVNSDSEGANEPFFTLQGFAGTGKTTIIGYVQKYFEASKRITDFRYIAPTHAATAQLAITTSKLGNTLMPSTVRSSVYESKDPATGAISYNIARKLKVGRFAYPIFIVDETSMLSQKDLDLLLNTVKRIKGKIIFMGDNKQIPEVIAGSNQTKNMNSAFQTDNTIVLDKVYRQSSSDLLDTLTDIRNKNHFDPAVKITNNDGTLQVLEKDKYNDSIIQDFQNDLENTVYIAYTNNAVSQFNKDIKQILNGETEPIIGEKIVGYLGLANKTIEDGNIANSISYIIKDIQKIYPELSIYSITAFSDMLDNLKKLGVKGVRGEAHALYAQLSSEDSFQFDGVTNEIMEATNKQISANISKLYKEHLEILAMRNSPEKWAILGKNKDSIQMELSRYEFGNSYVFDPEKEKLVLTSLMDPKKYTKVLKDTFTVEKGIDYGYGITAHKAQGMTVNNAYVDLENISRYASETPIMVKGEKVNTEKNALYYVAMSRAKNKVVLEKGNLDTKTKNKTKNETNTEKKIEPIKPQSKEFITNKVNSNFDKYGYVDILTSGKNNFDFKAAVIKYVLKDLGLEFKSDKELDNYLIKEKNEGRTFNLMQYVTLEEIPDSKTRVKLNKRNLLLDSVEDFKPKSLGGLNFTSSGRDFESKNIFKNNIEQAFNCK